MKIRKLTENDAKLISLPGSYGYVSDRIYEVSYSEENSLAEFKLELHKLSVPYKKIWVEEEATLNRYRLMIKDGISLAAISGGMAVGVLIAEKREWNNSVHIDKLHVDGGFRRRGIGSRLIAEFIETVSERGFRIVYLETQNTNYPAIQFYKENGFRITGIDMKLYDDDENKDEKAIYMTRELI